MGKKKRKSVLVSRKIWPRLDAAKTRLLLSLDRITLTAVLGVITGERTSRWITGTSDMYRMCEDGKELAAVEYILW